GYTRGVYGRAPIRCRPTASGGVQPQSGALCCSGCAHEHRVHGTFVLVPVGTLEHGTPETRWSWHGAPTPVSHKRAQPATAAGHSSLCMKAGAFGPQKGK